MALAGDCMEVRSFVFGFEFNPYGLRIFPEKNFDTPMESVSRVLRYSCGDLEIYALKGSQDRYLHPC
jgi:hypothetical protein